MITAWKRSISALACIALASATLLAGSAQAQTDPDSGFLAAEIETLGWASSTREGFDDTFSGEWPMVFTKFILDEVSPAINEINLLRGIDFRTDQQNGGSEGVNGTTSLVEKGGLPTLLGLAVEHGALQQARSGTSLTLSTTPYVAIALANGDTAENFRRYEFWSNFGISASFPLDSDADTLSSFEDFKNVSELAVKWQIKGNRNPRSKSFTEDWHDTFGSKIDALLEAETLAIYNVMKDERLKALYRNDALKRQVQSAIGERLAAYRSGQGGSEEERRRELTTIVREALRDAMGTTEDGGMVELPMELRREINDVIAPRLLRANRTLFGGKKSYEEQYMALLKEREPLIVTLKYAARFVEESSDISDVKALVEWSVGRIDLNFNGSLSFNNSADSALGQDTVREFAASGGITWSTFLEILPTRAPTTFSVAGKVTRNEDLGDTIGNAQARIEVPIGAGIRLPLAVTYASKTQDGSKDEWKFNVGMNLQTEKISSWLRMAALASALGGDFRLGE